MKAGMLWYNAGQPLDQAIQEAFDRYYQKFGVKPTLCYANAADLKAFATGRDPLTYKMPCAVRPSKTILQNHVWLGYEAELKPQDARLLAEQQGIDWEQRGQDLAGGAK